MQPHQLASPQAKFQLYTFLDSWPWYFALAYVGYVLSEH